MELKIKYLLFLIIIKNNVFSNNSFKGFLNKKNFLDIKNYSNEYIKKFYKSIALESNESGFLRVNIPLNKEFIDKYSNKNFILNKVRINYWPKGNFEILEESIHDHPRYFETYILNGGYVHEIYKVSQEPIDYKNFYNCFKLIKNQNEKSFIYDKIANLKLIKEEEVKKDSLKFFEKNQIHRVVKTSENTLSINVVFENKEDTNNIYGLPIYNVYLKEKNPMHIKTKRNAIFGEISRAYLDEIISLI